MNTARGISVLEKWLKLAFKLKMSDTLQNGGWYHRDGTARFLGTAQSCLPMNWKCLTSHTVWLKAEPLRFYLDLHKACGRSFTTDF